MEMVIIEGIDGTGKSTLVEELEFAMNEGGVPGEADMARSHNFPTNLPTPKQKEDLLARTLFHLGDFREQVASMRGFPGLLLFDRAYLSTLVYQGFTEGVLKDPIRYEAIFALGAEAFLGDARLGTVKSSNRVRATYILLDCTATEANRRIEAAGGRERADEVELMSSSKRKAHLQMLRDRYNIIFNDVESRLPLMYPQAGLTFHRVDTTKMDEEAVRAEVGGLLLEPIARNIPPLPLEF